MSNDYKNSLAVIGSFIAKTHPELITQIIHAYKSELSHAVANFHGYRIAHGPFTGMKLTPDAYWSPTDKASIVLGLYEQEILKELNSLKGQFSTLIDIGAADGYYAVGSLVGNICQKVYCFEMNKDGRAKVQETADLNNVGEFIKIFGAATRDFYNMIPDADRTPSILLVDIEGAEFDILTETVFNIFYNSIFIIELHDWFFKDGKDKIETLFSHFSRTHVAREIQYGPRNPDSFAELADLCDDDRWLLCSEGRAKSMKWLILEPNHYLKL